MRLPMHPVGTKIAASLPKSFAASRSNRFTVGSSAYTSSPPSASAMARRISGVGRVTVSLRRSTTFKAGPEAREFIAITGSVSIALTTQPPSQDLKSQTSPQNLNKSLVRHAESRGRQPNYRTVPFHQSRGCQRIEARCQISGVILFYSRHVDAIKLPQPQKQFFFERGLGRQSF